MKKEFLEIARIVTTHGVNGELKIEYWCDSPEVLSNQKVLYDGKKEYELLSVRNLDGNYALIRLQGIDSPEIGVRMREHILSVKRESLSLPDGSFFISEIIGLPVIDFNSGKVYGTLKEVLFYKPNEIYAIETDKGTVLLPHVSEFVKSTDIEKGIYITPSEGFFD